MKQVCLTPRRFLTQWSLVIALLIFLPLTTACRSDTQSKDSNTSSDSDTGLDSARQLEESDSANTSSDTVTDTAGEPFWDTDRDVEHIGNVAFAQDRILDYHITMNEALLEEMIEEGIDEEYREAALQITGDGVDLTIPKVGFRYKGDYSLSHCWSSSGRRLFSGDCAKLSMKIKFDQYIENARFDGLKRINLHGMGADESKMREMLAYGLYRDFGVDTARTAYVRMQINDEPPFLVLAVEHLDGRYTARHYYPNGDGNLYKEVWPRDTLTESAVRDALKTNEDPEDAADVSAFLDFGAAVSAATQRNFVETVGAYTDVTHLLRYMAVDRAIKNWDGITVFYWPERPHNFYWYHDVENTGRIWLIPWDLDNTFWEHDPYMDVDGLEAERPIPNWNVKPATCELITVWDEFGVPPVGCDPLINLLAATGWDEFATLGNELLTGLFTADKMNADLDRWEQLIAPVVADDPYLTAKRWQSAVADLRDILADYITDFEAHLQEGYVAEAQK
ncbi:MAG: CotH kinase family protein [Deltaproteobacteria bacterium]|nr:CotH kinase family protein [Deltaproteobacteria bacterium]